MSDDDGAPRGAAPAPIDFSSMPPTEPVREPVSAEGNTSALPEAHRPPTGEYLVAATGWEMRKVGRTVADADPATRQMIVKDAVLAVRAGVDLTKLGLSPFEAHVASFIDGGRPVARIAAKAGLTIDDVGIAITQLAERRAVERVGTAVSTKPERETTEERQQGLVEALKREAFNLPNTDPTAGLVDPLSVPSTEAAEVPPLPSVPVTPPPVPADPAAAQATSASSGGGPSAAPGGAKVRTRRSRQLTIDPDTKQVVVVEREVALPVEAEAPVPPEPRAVSPKQRHAKKAWLLAKADIEAGRMPRALGHVRMAAQLAPGEPLYRAMIINWGRVGEILSGELKFGPDGSALEST